MRKPSIECSQVISLVTLRILRSVAARAVFLFVAATVISCGCKQVVRNPASPAPPPIKVAVQYWPGIYWLGIADEKGWFKEAGLNVQLVDTNTDYFASVKDFAKGRFDVNNLVLYDLLDSLAGGADLVGVINVDYSTGAEKLIARPGIERTRGSEREEDSPPPEKLPWLRSGGSNRTRRTEGQRRADS